ncbi:MAG: NUDIX hydrolase, partial [Sphingopyxis sp.]
MNDAWKTPTTNTVPALPAATILLLRDRGAGVEVLMVKRGAGAFFGSALVFPGGKLDPADEHPDWLAHISGHDGLSAQDIALRIAGWREVFEETGLLPAQCPLPDGVDGAAMPFIDLIRQSGGALPLGDMQPYARWITPKISPKRFDTHFFLCALDGDDGVADGFETVSTEWLTPTLALEMGERGDRNVIFPTRCQLQRLAQSATIADALAAAAATPIITVEPARVERADGVF